ncbi:MAG: alpha/beta hydrolase [Gammaproteobacteria bacterium]
MNTIIPGPSGSLESLLTEPKNNPRTITGIICHPHSLMGGTMHNKVVTTIARAFDALGLRTIRFNFRGVGASEGVYDRGIGETEDIFAVIDWVQKHHPHDKIWLAGFSFGAYVSLRAATQKSELISQLVSIAPPPLYTTQNLDIAFDISPNPHLSCPWVVIQGDADEIVVPHQVYDWISRMDHPPQLIRLPEASHFFHGCLIELQETLVTALKDESLRTV